MKSIFSDIYNKCKKPTVEILNEALSQRYKLSESESNFITYIAGFTHYEFAQNLFNNYGLIFICENLIVFDKPNQKFHVKVLINDPMDLSCFSMNSIDADENIELLELDKYLDLAFTDSYIDNKISWRNSDGFYIDNLYKEIKNLNQLQYQKYCDNRIVGLNEKVFSYELTNNNISFVIHAATVPMNIETNLFTVLDRVSNAMFIYHHNDGSHLSIGNLRGRKNIYHQLSTIKWSILGIEDPQEVVTLFDEINAEYTLISYQGEDYNYFNTFVSNILDFYIPKIKLLNLI